jgi:hypothetical protein
MNRLARALPAPPAGLRVGRRASPGALVISRRWARPKHVILVALAGVLAAYLVPRWIAISKGAAESSALFMLGTIAATWFTLRVASALVSRTTITVSGRTIEVRHGPLPSLAWRPASVAREGVRDFEARPWGPRHEVVAVRSDGTRTCLVRPLITPEQAEYVRDALRSAWELPDGEVPPESASPVNEALRSGGPGFGLVAIPLVVALILVFAYFMVSSHVEGSVTLGEGTEATTFIPTDCRSGVPRGFFGVELMSDEARGTVVRVVRDPTRGSMLAVERGGGAPQLFGPDACTSLHLNVEQTDTNVNDVWSLRGSARAECEGLSVNVRFDGCH